jgi:hypothetical protein
VAAVSAGDTAGEPGPVVVVHVAGTGGPVVVTVTEYHTVCALC